MGNILDFLVASPNTVFLVAGCVVVGLFLLELIMMIIGHSLMMAHGDVDMTLDLDGNGIPDYLETGHFHLGELFNPGNVPTTMFLVIFSGALSMVGFSGQWILLNNYGWLAPALLAVPMALVPTLAITRWATVGMAKIMPQDETNAIALESLSGEVGVITAGPIQGTNDFGMARFTDKYGVDHRLMVSGVDETVIATGSDVVLVGPHPDKAIAYVVRKI